MKRSRAARIYSSAWRALPVLLAPLQWALAAESAAPVRTLTQGDDVLSFPSFGRILLAFIVAAALAIGIAVALKQVLPRLGKGIAVSSRLKAVDRIHLSSAVRVHLVEVDNERVVIAENRGAITIAVLPDQRKSQEV